MLWLAQLASPADARTPRAPVLPAWQEADHCTSQGLRTSLSSGTTDDEGWRSVVIEGHHLRRRSDSGSGSGFAEVSLRRGDQVTTVSWESSFGAMTSTVSQPQGLSSQALSRLGDALYGTVCDTPDPSLAWLLQPERPVWYRGPAVVPPFYALDANGSWTSYAGHTQAGLTGDKRYPELLAERGGVQVKAFAHGVYVESQGRHSWVYVSAGHQKLRWPSVYSAIFRADGTLEVTRHPSPMNEISAPIVTLRHL